MATLSPMLHHHDKLGVESERGLGFAVDLVRRLALRLMAAWLLFLLLSHQTAVVLEGRLLEDPVAVAFDATGGARQVLEVRGGARLPVSGDMPTMSELKAVAQGVAERMTAARGVSDWSLASESGENARSVWLEGRTVLDEPVSVVAYATRVNVPGGASLTEAGVNVAIKATDPDAPIRPLRRQVLGALQSGTLERPRDIVLATHLQGAVAQQVADAPAALVEAMARKVEAEITVTRQGDGWYEAWAISPRLPRAAELRRDGSEREGALGEPGNLYFLIDQRTSGLPRVVVRGPEAGMREDG